MGRPRKPTVLKMLEGTYRKDRAPESEPQFETEGSDQPPEHLEGLALEAWLELAPDLSKIGLLTKVDRRILESYCVAYELSREAKADIDINGTVLQASSGNKTKNPSCTVLNESLGLMAKYSSLLGLNPESRNRISGASKQKEDNGFTTKK